MCRGHAYATASFSSPVVSALGSESDDPGSSPGWGKIKSQQANNINLSLNHVTEPSAFFDYPQNSS